MLWVDNEKLLNPVTALSGSGPAYVFLLIEVLEKAGIHIGLAPDMARKLARQTVIGSASLAEASPETPASKLRENVTSPNGTTQAALDVLMPSDMQKIFDAALAAATKRAEELAQ
jgi:pyrroline-5-carboxylate reductase